MAVSELFIDKVFDEVWLSWVNKEKGENAPRKAVAVCLRSSDDPKATATKLIEACRIYSLLHEGDDPQFTKALNNFINQDEWLDIFDRNSLAALEAQRVEALKLIQAWNSTCKKHWCPVLDQETRIPMAKRALLNKEFKNSYQKSLDLAAKIFEYPYNESDPRSKVTLSFRWFTDVTPYKLTFLKILEGEYGHPPRSEKKYKTKEWKNPSLEQKKQVAEDFKAIFGKELGDVSKNSKSSAKFNSRPELDEGSQESAEETSLEEIRGICANYAETHGQSSPPDDPYTFYD